MANRTHVCDVTLNGTRASVFEVANKGAVQHEVEIYTPSAIISPATTFTTFVKRRLQ
jgi:hypothetical protein